MRLGARRGVTRREAVLQKMLGAAMTGAGLLCLEESRDCRGTNVEWIVLDCERPGRANLE